MCVCVCVCVCARVVSHHEHGLRVDGLCHHITVVCDVLDHLVESRSLHLFVFEVAERVTDKVKEDAALTQLLNEQLLPLQQGGI